jgi:hypothetical protein
MDPSLAQKITSNEIILGNLSHIQHVYQVPHDPYKVIVTSNDSIYIWKVENAKNYKTIKHASFTPHTELTPISAKVMIYKTPGHQAHAIQLDLSGKIPAMELEPQLWKPLGNEYFVKTQRTPVGTDLVTVYDKSFSSIFTYASSPSNELHRDLSTESNASQVEGVTLTERGALMILRRGDIKIFEKKPTENTFELKSLDQRPAFLNELQTYKAVPLASGKLFIYGISKTTSEIKMASESKNETPRPAFVDRFYYYDIRSQKTETIPYDAKDDAILIDQAHVTPDGILYAVQANFQIKIIDFKNKKYACSGLRDARDAVGAMRSVMTDAGMIILYDNVSNTIILIDTLYKLSKKSSLAHTSLFADSSTHLLSHASSSTLSKTNEPIKEGIGSNCCVIL